MFRQKQHLIFPVDVEVVRRRCLQFSAFFDHIRLFSVVLSLLQFLFSLFIFSAVAGGLRTVRACLVLFLPGRQCFLDPRSLDFFVFSSKSASWFIYLFFFPLLLQSRDANVQVVKCPWRATESNMNAKTLCGYSGFSSYLFNICCVFR